VSQKLPFALRAYQGMTGLLAPFLPGILSRRAARGKEEVARLGERLGTAPIERPPGPLVWIHGASVGESLVSLSVAEAMRRARPDLTFLFTSGTKTSSDMIAKRLVGRDLHRYLPVDVPKAARAFVEGWKPDLAVFVEGEIWPNLILIAQAAGVPMALINARMTNKSIKGWANRLPSARVLFDAFALAIPADSRTQEALSLFRTGPVGQPGNLKLAAPAPGLDAREVKALGSQLKERPVWLAASTHAGEESVILAAHAALCLASPKALLILAPRHPDRATDVEVDCRKAGFIPVRRSRGDVPQLGHGVWLWDTLGELGLAMSLAPVTFVAGSLAPDIGGHNPVEPARLGSAIVSGASVSNFADLYGALEEAGGAVMLDEPSSDRLALAIADLMGNSERASAMKAAALRVVDAGVGAMDASVAALLALLNGPRA
jgi:3-deoxy-D-manno-octulosonic-acid transferase